VGTRGRGKKASFNFSDRVSLVDIDGGRAVNLHSGEYGMDFVLANLFL
jgi:hypothetical protein